MKNDGFQQYISDNGNKLDLLMLAAFVCYFVLRLGYTFHGVNVIIPSVIGVSNYEAMTPDWFALMILNVLISIQIVIKICFFCKVNERFGMLVQLILTCIHDVEAFAIFMVIWLFAFTLIFILLGANDDVGQTYVDLNEFWGYFFLIWENSIGNINPPTYHFWMDKLNNSKMEPYQTTSSHLTIYIIWFMWFANQALILIILLNFLIAVISQSYENVMNSSVPFKYQQRCELIREAAVIYEAFGLSTTYSIVVLQANIGGEGGSGDWAGFV